MRLLIIEDDKKVASFVKRGLEEERYAVEMVHDGAKAMEMVMSTPYDCIVLDIMLPKKDGFSVIRDMRALGNMTPVIMLTAKSSIEDKVTGLDLGADDYLAKPFNLEELTARVRSILRRSGPEKSTKLRCGDLILDTVSHLAYRFGREIELTTKEYSLVEYLMRNKNKILSRSTITQHVWKHNFDPESNIIDVYIKRLRQKIETEDTRPLIQSVRGVGYRLREFMDGNGKKVIKERV